MGLTILKRKRHREVAAYIDLEELELWIIWCWKICSKMTFMKGEPLVRKVAVFAKYLVLPGAMAAALVYSPPDYAYDKNHDKPSK